MFLSHRKFSLLISMLIVSVLSFSHTASANHHHKDKQNHKPNLVTFSKNSVIQIYFLDLNDGQASTTFPGYFSTLKHSVKKLGGRVEAKLDTYQVVEGLFKPHYIIMIEWPSVAAVEEHLQIMQTEPYASTQRSIVRDVHFSLYTTDNDVSFKLNTESIYEFWFLKFSSPQSPDLMYQLYQTSLATMTFYGRNALIDLKPLNHPQSDHKRDLAGLSEWPSAAHFYKFISEDLVVNAIHQYRDPAVQNIEMINAQFRK